MILSGKQKRFLRSEANHLKAIVMIGKDGVTSNIISTLNDALEAHELVKVSILKTCDIDGNEITIELMKDTHCELVQTIGRTIVLYRKSKEPKIILP